MQVSQLTYVESQSFTRYQTFQVTSTRVLCGRGRSQIYPHRYDRTHQFNSTGAY